MFLKTAVPYIKRHSVNQVSLQFVSKLYFDYKVRTSGSTSSGTFIDVNLIQQYYLKKLRKLIFQHTLLVAKAPIKEYI